MVAQTAADILNAGKVGQPTMFHIESWDCDIYIADPSAATIEFIQEYCESLPKDEEGKPKFTQRSAVEISVRMLCDSEGKLLFSPDDIDNLMLSTKPKGWLEAMNHCSNFFNLDSETVEQATKN